MSDQIEDQNVVEKQVDQVVPDEPKVVEEPKVEPEKTVSLKDHQKALDDLMRYKKEARTANEQIKQNELASLKEKENWKEVARKFEEENEKLKSDNQNLSTSLVENEKYRAVKAAALKAGLRKEAIDDLELLPLDDVLVERTSLGRVNVLGVDDHIRKVKTTRPHWFGSRVNNVNPGQPEVVADATLVTYDMLMKAETKAKETGDYAPYQKLMLQYKRQNQ